MPNLNGSDDRKTKWIRRIARVWGTLVITVIVLILMGYVSNWIRTGTVDLHAAEDYPLVENLPPLFILLSAVGLGVAWRWEGVGGALAVVFQLTNLPVLLMH